MTAPPLPRLTVPLPQDPFTPCAGDTGDAGEPAGPPPADGEAELAWYRWLLGHHGAFCAWRLLSAALGRGDLGEAADLHDTYSALLLYSGSCTPEVYCSVIRPRMAARHPAMSGTWARDHRHAAALLAAARPAPGSALKVAVKFNRLVHMTVAARLVPDGGSLLRDAGRDVHCAPTEGEQALLDDFFLVDRAPVCAHVFTAALRERVAALLADLAARPVRASYDRDAVNQFQVDLPVHIGRLVPIAETALAEGANA
ncbi:L-tyrosine 3-hydroxylase [Amycolatopsis sp. Hca4]|uniref:L-tyrosine 3-hydroxylase n=1 Tax=Amycolatopsis sp. Hca4 TaxID=2742131 RepID=UPI001591E63E|nr:L-tyrosine 3-hydroxylase [Amycolatopsis sp. Hca4]QKV74044.1 L-tyrosine 3-hydroxylase [Amycolatopsis sp. Hca4]